jgi:hypothetical protein
MAKDFEVTLSIPTYVNVPLGKETGLSNHIPIEDFDKAVLRMALVNGFVKALGDISRGKDDKDKENDDAAWQGLREKRIDGWKRGHWAKGERGDSNMALVKDQFYFEQMSDGGMSTRGIDKLIKDTVESTMGKDAKATFDNFLASLAKLTLPDGTESEVEAEAEALESALMERAMKRKAEQDKAADKIKVPANIAALIKGK